jgi:hypothetical protein
MWGAGGVLNWTNAGPAVAVDVTAIEYSPNYPIDATLMAVTSAAAAQPVLQHNVGGVWGTIPNQNVGATAVTDFDGATAAVGTDLQYADIALPADYNGTTPTLRRAYVSIVGEAGYGATTSNVYRVDNAAGVALNPGVELGSIDYAGTYGDGTLMGGLVAKAAAVAANVYYTSSAMSITPTWYPATNAPSGVSIAAIVPGAAGVLSTYLSTIHIDMDSNFATSSTVVAGTVGNDSALAASTDAGVSWNERGRLTTAALLQAMHSPLPQAAM